MSHSLRTSTAVSLVVLASMVAGCAGPQSRVGSAAQFGGKAPGDVGLAMRALAALNSNNVPMAIDLAERAVAKTPRDAGFRGLLGNCYFAAGRFASAESAYKDALTIYSNQPQVVLKLALVQIALGKNDEAIGFLAAGRSVLDDSDYGLALALAGHPADAIAVLEPAAREVDADARVRQNLALAYAFAGDWTKARTVAAQDVPASQLDARIQQWMQLAKPQHASDQVASLIGVTPAAVDAGQPVQLALNKGDTHQALAVAAPAPPPVPQQVAETAPAKATFVATSAPVAAPPVVQAVAPAPPPPRATLATLAESAVSEAKSVLAAFVPHSQAPAAKPARARRVVAAAVRHGNSPAVLQLGAYGSSERVLAAWNGAAKKYGVLKAYLPMSARFASPKGVFYRLSVKGFASDRDARLACESLRRQGGSCFVRNFAGDVPVQYASR
jgi:D-alanyl-D-alanine carboxypeptidase